MEQDMEGDMTGRVALVTGASEGIGLATAKLLARRGATVAICARKQDKLDRALEELKAIRADAEAHVLDVSDTDACTALIEDIAARHGRLDMLVNNAMSNNYGAIADNSLKQWR
jgi:meso-butanediol dehydrogenase/(S,S)-butanediol dehydrogenase/diacetyl reductase